MDDFKVEKIRLEDGRHAERHVHESDDERVVEIHEEPVREKLLTQRVIEKKKPVVVERTIETIRNGEVVEQKKESIEPDTKMQLRSVVKKKLARHEREALKVAPSGHEMVTRKELKEALVAAVKTVQETGKAPQPLKAVRPLSAQQEVEQRVKAGEKPSWKTVGLYALIAAQVAGLAYVVFWM
jgi:hypothetical protein